MTAPNAEEERNNQSQRGAWIAKWGVQTVGEEGRGQGDWDMRRNEEMKISLFLCPKCWKKCRILITFLLILNSV